MDLRHRSCVHGGCLLGSIFCHPASASRRASGNSQVQGATEGRDEAQRSLKAAAAAVEAAARELAGAEAGDGRDESNRSLQERLADTQRARVSSELVLAKDRIGALLHGLQDHAASSSCRTAISSPSREQLRLLRCRHSCRVIFNSQDPASNTDHHFYRNLCRAAKCMSVSSSLIQPEKYRHNDVW